MQDLEEWKPITNFEGLYDISSFGRVRSCGRKVKCRNGVVTQFRERILRQYHNKDNGYYTVSLGKDSRFRSYYVHRLVAAAFVPNQDFLPEVNHIDENKLNNKADNLEWCSRVYNARYGTGEERRYASAKTNKRGKCYPKTILQIDPITNKVLAKYNSSQDAARALGVSDGTNIRKCARGGLHSKVLGYHWKYDE